MAIELKVKGTTEAYVLHPVKIVCLGKNYAAHAREFDSEVPEEPMFFVKTPSCLIADGEAIHLPRPELGIKRVDHEVELGVIIGRAARHVTAEDAMDHVLGYTVFNDVTARDLQKADTGRGWPWFRSKNLDTFGPIGPVMVLKDDLDPYNLTLELKVNGKTKQRASTKDMIVSIEETISTVSAYMTLEEGDVIATGTPEGVGPLVEGDIVEASVEGIGTLRNNVVQG